MISAYRATPHTMPHRTVPYRHCTNTTPGAQPYEDTKKACPAQRTLEHKRVSLTAKPTPQVCTQGAGGVEKSITNKGTALEIGNTTAVSVDTPSKQG